MSDRHYLLSPQSMEFIMEFFNNLSEVIVTHKRVGETMIMDSRRHLLFKSLMGRGVNVACGDEEGFESHFYLATDLSLLTRAIPWYGYGEKSYVFITRSARLEHSLPLLVEMVTSKVSPMAGVSMPKVNLTGIHSIPHIKAIPFQRRHF